jgi:carbon storage regulator
MLVLSRKREQKIVIADGLIVITIVDLKNGVVRIGLDAPKDIPIRREEVAPLESVSG